MKLYVRSTVTSAKYGVALKKLKKILDSKGVKCEINKDHNCVDVFDSNGFISEQHYARETDSVSVKKYYYKYVGPGQGDYIKMDHVREERRYTELDPYIKFIKFTNDPKDHRNSGVI